jgi:hypothetical protein
VSTVDAPLATALWTLAARFLTADFVADRSGAVFLVFFTRERRSIRVCVRRAGAGDGDTAGFRNTTTGGGGGGDGGGAGAGWTRWIRVAGGGAGGGAGAG